MSTHRTDIRGSEYQALYDLVVDQFARADLTFREDDVTLLVDDLKALASEELAWNDEPFEDCYDEWMRRIGGPRNVPSYLACLQAGRRRRVHAARGHVGNHGVPERFSHPLDSE